MDGISVTAEHPFCTAPGQFTEVQLLKKGTKIADVSIKDGLRFLPVQELVKVEKPGSFHNITVDGTHTYIISPASRERERERRHLVHNKGGNTGGSGK